MALDEGQKLAITVVIFILLISGLSYIIWKDRAQWRQMSDQNAVLRQEIDRLNKEKVNKIPELQARLDSMKKHEGLYKKILPTEKEDRAFLDFIERARKETGVEISLIAEERVPGEQSRSGKAAPYDTYAFELKMIATLDQAIRFFNMLEYHGYDGKYMRLIQVDDFKIKKLDDEENTLNQNEVRVKVSIYSYREPVVPAVKAAAPATPVEGGQ